MIKEVNDNQFQIVQNGPGEASVLFKGVTDRGLAVELEDRLGAYGLSSDWLRADEQQTPDGYLIYYSLSDDRDDDEEGYREESEDVVDRLLSDEP